MPVHDWTRVDAGTSHDFHNGWIIHLKEALNGGLLPEGYYAMSEQWMTGFVADVLTLQAPLPDVPPPPLPATQGGVALVDAPPRVRRKMSLAAAMRGLQRTLTIRHVSGHRIVALMEIVSPANKDRAAHLEDFVDKVEMALWRGIHVLVVDLIPPGVHDPQGVHGAIAERFETEPCGLPSDEPLTLASYVADWQPGRAVSGPDAYLEYVAEGAPLPEMPLFFSPDRYINVPLDSTYMASYHGMPAVWRDMLEGSQTRPD